jgi:hypothetical protein
MTKAAIPFGALPPAALPGWATAGSGGYLAYVALGNSLDAVDWSGPAGFAQAGQAVAYVRGYSFTPGERYAVALRAVSDAGVEEEGVAAYCTLTISAGGDLAGNKPNAPLAASAVAVADGYVDVQVTYSRQAEKAVAVRVDVAAFVGDEVDWATVLGTATLGGGQYSIETITVGPLAEGVAVRLAARAVSADEVAGPEAWCDPVAPDAAGPSPAASLTAEAV